MNLKLQSKSRTIYAFLMALFSVWGWGQATLPVSRTTWTGAEPAGWLQNGTTDRTSTSACTGNNALIFGNNNSWIQVNFDTTPDKLNFSLKKQGTSGQSKVTVEESVDATNWTTIGVYGTATGSVAISDCDNIEIALSPASRYVKWMYTKANGNIDMDDVSITSGCLPSTFSFASASVNKTSADLPFTNAFSSDNTSAKIWSSSNTAVATADSNGEVTLAGAGTTNISVVQASDGTHCAVSISYLLTVTAPTFPVSASVNNTNFGTVSVSGNEITGTPSAGYTYATPAYTIISGSATVSQNGNVFTVAPSSATEVQINFEAKPNYTLSLMNDGANYTNANFPFVTYEGNTITLPTLANCGNYTFAGWDTNGSTTAAPTYAGGAIYTTTSGNVTLYAVYQTTSGTPAVTYSYGFENNDTGWTSDATQSSAEVKLGTYSGRINTNNVHVTYDNIVASPSSITFSLKKTSTNNNYNIAVETSPDKIVWTPLVTYPMSDFTNGSWTEKTANLSAYQNVYVRIYYTGTTAIRYIDDVRLVSGGFTTIYTTTPNCASTTTWDGTTWSNGTPSSSLNAFISSNYSGIGFTAQNLTINPTYTLTINNGQTVTAGNVTNNGNIIVNDGGNFVQTTGGIYTPGTGASFITNRNSASVGGKYVFWSSPVANQNFYTAYANGSSATEPTYVMTYDTATNLYPNVTNDDANFTNNAGRGYSVKVPANNATVVFGGSSQIPNNGTVNVALAGTSGGINNFNLIGNPYPSNIDLNAFYSANQSLLNSTFWFWDNTTANVTTQTGNTSVNVGYATMNAADPAGNTWVEAPGTQTYNNTVLNATGNIAKVGQGFIVKALNAGNVSFTNAMRSSSVGGTLNKNANSGKFWIKLTTSYGNTVTQAITYSQGASDAYDVYDSKAMGMGSDAFYSLVGTEKLVIQGRSSFNNNDVVQLGNKHFESGNFTISLSHKEGLFANGQDIYLHDKQTGTYTNLQSGAYNFSANAGDFTSRFEIVYKLNVLSTNESGKGTFEIYRDGEDFVVRNNKNIQSVEVFDATGRKLQQVASNSKSVTVKIQAKGLYILKAVSEGREYSQKIVK